MHSVKVSERFIVMKHDEPSGLNYENHGSTLAQTDVEFKEKWLTVSGMSGYDKAVSIDEDGTRQSNRNGYGKCN